MLRALRVRNFAVIESAEIPFEPGLCAFTGETGAGKSILIEALGFLMGERGSTDWVRSGCQKLEVEGVFVSEGGGSTIRRELDASGKSRAFVDGKPVTLARLGEVTEGLADFHGQHEHQTLLKPAVQLELLDGYGGLGREREAVGDAWRRWKEFKSLLESLALSEEERERRLDLYAFQLKEIESVDPRPGEDAELEAELPRLKHAERLLSLAQEAHSILYEAEGSAEESLGKAERALEEMSRLDPAMGEPLEALSRLREGVGEVAAGLSRYQEEAGVSPQRLDELIGRQDRIERLKRKYGSGIAEVLAHRDRIRSELAALENHEQRRTELAGQLERAEEELRRRSEELHAARMKAAKKLSAKVVAELKDLGMGSARLTVSAEMEEDDLTPLGSDRVEFLIAPNPGEPLKPLRGIASGGELSRVMLALKTVLAREDHVPLLVFDEVDAGVGAVVAAAVGTKLEAVSRSRQVFCVTHMAQVACRAKNHYEVSKRVSGGRTYTRVERLSGRSRVQALARMLGGPKVTDTSLKHAQELLRAE
ncbi:MAG: DNA repair protein RecN [Elusimicrobiota bacterium]